MLLRRFIPLTLLLSLVAPVVAQQKADPTADLTALLHQFLDAAGRNDKAVFDRFWAEDVLYTGSSGRHVTKADIMKSLDEPPKPDDPQVTFDADQITVHDYGNFAVVAFRLIQNVVNKDGSKETHYYRNTGTFQKRDGRWQAVAWQATKVPEPEKAK
ncbi:MAG TPA: nuclear transport factor 2 family protein [Terriglobales bacterium]|jgi:ketosteroid isomerase-like protein|nr:nuclear transport factor 2 family protein [Terriglobales bacterium]